MTKRKTAYSIYGLNEVLDCCKIEASPPVDNGLSLPYSKFTLLTVPMPRTTSTLEGFHNGRTKRYIDKVTPESSKFGELHPKCNKNETNEDNHDQTSDYAFDEILSHHQTELATWINWMKVSDCSNLLLYGLGSKMKILNAMKGLLKREFQFVEIFNGWIHDVKFIYRSLIQSLKGSVNAKAVESLKLELRDTLKSRDIQFRSRSKINIDNRPLLCLIIHSLDGGLLRQHQGALAELAQYHNKIQFVVSVDHLHYPFLWSTSMLSTFNFLHLHVPTYEAYKNEIYAKRKGESIPPWLSKSNVIKSIDCDCVSNALISMPVKNKQLFELIAKLTTKSNVNKTNDGWVKLSKSDLFYNAREMMIYTDTSKFYQATKELIDHQLLEEFDDSLYIIPIPQEVFRQLYPNIVKNKSLEEDVESEEESQSDE